MALNAFFYLSRCSGWLRLISLPWFYALTFWLISQIYVFLLLIEQHDKRILLIFKNALVLTLQNPLFTLIISLLLILSMVVTLGIVPLAIFLSMSLFTLIQNKATKE